MQFLPKVEWEITRYKSSLFTNKTGIIFNVELNNFLSILPHNIISASFI